MKAELEILRGEVHDSIVARLHWGGKTFESVCAPEMGHISEAEFVQLGKVFRENLETELLEMMQKAMRGDKDGASGSVR